MDIKTRIEEVKQQINIKQHELCDLQMELDRLEEDLIREVGSQKMTLDIHTGWCRHYPCSRTNGFWGVTDDYCTFCDNYEP